MNNPSFGADDPIETIIQRYADLVYKLAYAKTRHPQDAEDIFQEVFLRYFRVCPRFENEAHRKAWLMRVTVNCAKKYWASAWVRRTVPLEEDVVFEMPEDQLLYEQLQTLPGKYRAVLHLFYYEELSVEEISRILGQKPSTVRTQLTRGRRMLKKKLEEDTLC